MLFFAAREAVRAFDIKLALKEIRLTNSERDEMASITNVCLFFDIIDKHFFLVSLCQLTKHFTYYRGCF